MDRVRARASVQACRLEPGLLWSVGAPPRPRKRTTAKITPNQAAEPAK